MQTQHNVPLSQLTTMRLGGLARQVITITSSAELLEALNSLTQTGERYFVLGSGSNVIARDDEFAGTILLNRILGFEIISDTDSGTVIKIGAGENWDQIVARTCEMGLSGIEAMSAIPGTAGATPVQNVGAYGQEIANTLVELEALDTTDMKFVTLSNQQCEFTYRSSVFKNPATRHHIITSITLKLRRTEMLPPFYTSLQHYLDKHQITDYSPLSIRQAVTSIRATKLPDPSAVANTGSFFKNPIVEAATAAQLLVDFPDMPQFAVDDNQVKLAAGWLIEQAGLKGHHRYGLKTSEDNALVIINQSARSYHDLLSFRDEIIKIVHEKFGVQLQQEPETL